MLCKSTFLVEVTSTGLGFSLSVDSEFFNFSRKRLESAVNVFTNNSAIHTSTYFGLVKCLCFSCQQKNTWCSCCLVFQTIPEVKKEVQINRQTIFYKLESFPSVFPSKRILLLCPHPNLAWHYGSLSLLISILRKDWSSTFIHKRFATFCHLDFTPFWFREEFTVLLFPSQSRKMEELK